MRQGFIERLMCMLVAVALPVSWSLALPPGLELEVGGPGHGSGKLWHIDDITFGPANHLYVLDGGRWATKREADQKIIGNLLVQQFTDEGRFIAQFSIAGEGARRVHLPARIAVDSASDVYLTVPGAGEVERYDAAGKLKRKYSIPGAMGITTWQRGDRQVIAVVGGVRQLVDRKGWTQVGGEQITIIDPSAAATTTVKLERPLENVTDLTAGPDGDLYAQAGSVIVKISPQGRFIRRLGSNPTFDGRLVRSNDGAEPIHTVAVDSKGAIYSWGWGNPGELVRYSADLKTVSLRGGEYKFADYWSPAGAYVPVTVDANDKVWVGVPNFSADSEGERGKHTRGWVHRLRPDYLEPSPRVKTLDTRLLGMRPAIAATLPYSIAYEPGTFELSLVLPAANRLIDSLSVRWSAFDLYKNPIDQGAFELKLVNDQDTTAPFSVKTPRFGWYTVELALVHEGDVLMTLGRHFGVTPRYQGMVELADGESKGGWEDVPRQMFAGLSNVRLHPGERSEASLEAAAKYGATAFMQITSNPKDLTPEKVRPLFERFKGKVKYWEVINEPNFTISAEKLAEAYAWLYPMLKQIDPDALVMGPAVCGLILPYHEAFFKAGGAKYLDIVAVHDYEGNESVDPYHWRWKFAELRRMMNEYGIGDRPIWQTERALMGVRGRNTILANQAIRTTLQRDLLETIGIAPEHNNHYYLNEGGYGTVPSFVWSGDGPHPAALALRTRYALTLGQKYQGALDFGPHGSDLLLGLAYASDDRQTLLLRNLGTIRDMELTLAISGGSPSATVFDAFGNQRQEPVVDGKLQLTIGQMPVYVRLAAEQKIQCQRFDFGHNVTSQATFSFSGEYKEEFGKLTNGIMENIHHGTPWGQVWNAKLDAPQTLELAFSQPQTIHAIELFSTRADNIFCSLRDYDLEYHDGSGWKTIEQVRRQIPESSPARSAGAVANTWGQDDNIYLHQFAPLTTDRLRIRFLRTTQGYVPDDKTTSNGSIIAQQVQLREVRVFSAD